MYDWPISGSYGEQEAVNPIDHCHERLHRAGWSVGEVRIATANGLAWLVSGSNGENRIDARGTTLGRIDPRGQAAVEAQGDHVPQALAMAIQQPRPGRPVAA